MISRFASPASRPPGPGPGRWGANLAAYEADRLGFLLATRDRFGGVVAFDSRTTLIHDPDLAHEVLVDRADAFAILGNFLGQRRSESEARAVRSARAEFSPELRASAVEVFSSQIAEAVRSELETVVGERETSLRSLGRRNLATVSDMGRTPDVGKEPVPLGRAWFDPLAVVEPAMARAVCEFYVGQDWEVVRDHVGELLRSLDAVFGNPFALPAVVPTPGRVRINRRYRRTRDAVDAVVAARRRQVSGDDYVARLVRRPGIAAMPTGQISDMVIGSLLAGYRVPAAGAAWVLLELAARRSLAQHDLRALVLEVLRLHPPTWQLTRRVTRPVEIGGYMLEPGHQVVISPYVIHRDSRVFERPLELDPARWSGGHPARRGYLAFGRGAHLCPGQHLGLLSIVTAVQVVTERWRVVQPEGVTWREDPRSTLIPVGARVGLIERSPQADDDARRFSTR